MDAFSQDPESDQPSESVAVERRVSPRVPCDLETKCRPIADARGLAWPAHAVDISTVGISLVLERRFERGAILSTNLASADGETERTLFLRVVHVARQDDGNWHHGCAFVSELAQEELRAFQEEGPRSCNVRTECRVLKPTQSGVWSARVLKIWPRGLKLLAERELERGTILTVKLPGDDKPRYTLVRVLRARAFSSDGWLLACEFADKVTDEDLQRFQLPM